jgi:ferrochelatase
MANMKIAVILFNLGGPDKLESVKPFLFNLFNDKAIITAPNPFRFLIAKLISSKREKTAQEIYSHLNGKSPILEETLAQKTALEKELIKNDNKNSYKCFIAMRYWHPRAEDVIKEVKKYKADKIILLPLYPQFSTTTSNSSINEWQEEAKKQNLKTATITICCYPKDDLFIKAHTDLIKKHLKKIKNKNYRILFSAHGLPQKIIENGDPYEWQIRETTHKIIKELNIKNLDYINCFQSKVGPLKWLEPSTETEIIRAGKDKKSLILVPIAFISEHSETLVELDIEYKELADANKVKEYIRIPTLSVNKYFISSLANLVKNSLKTNNEFYRERVCPANFCKCYKLMNE